MLNGVIDLPRDFTLVFVPILFPANRRRAVLQLGEYLNVLNVTGLGT